VNNALTRNWRLVVLRGVLAILLGLAAFVWPSITWIVMVMMFGIYTLMDGLVALGTGLSRTTDSPRWWGFFGEGLISIGVAVVALIWPELTAFIIIFLIAGLAVFTGILEIVAAIRLRHEINNEWLLALGGMISIVLGVLLFIQPVAGGIAIIWTVAAYAMIFGVLLIALGFRLKNQSAPGSRQALRSA
jgi:uncharacterized membrane protein HdeD (DUF308 family)